MEWLQTDKPVPYEAALAFMDERVAGIRADDAPEAVWLLEHPPLYTAGTSADPAELLQPGRLPVFDTGRGGRYTYHGPGQRIAYVMIDLKKRGGDLRRYVADLEQWIIETLEGLGVRGQRRADRIGIWVVRDNGDEEKIAALGVRVRRWVSFHGIAINVAPDLSHFEGIVPCGVERHGVTSLDDLGVGADMAEVDKHLRAAFEKVFAMTPDDPRRLDIP